MRKYNCIKIYFIYKGITSNSKIIMISKLKE